ncbi:hypothetical protein L3Q82_018531, partial [Scortum barcoo]
MRFSSRSWNTGPALYPPQGAGGFMGVCPTSPHVLSCGSGEGIRPCPSWYSVGRCSASMGSKGPLLRAVRSLYDRSRSLVRIAGRAGGSPVWEPQDFISLLFADDVVLLASSQARTFSMCWSGLQPKCEAAGMRISTSKSEAMVLDQEKGWRALSGWVERSCLKWRSSRDRVRSSVTREELRSRAAAPSHPERSQLRWLGHLFRMPPGRPSLGRCSRRVPPGGGPGEDPGHAGETDYVSRLAWERLGIRPPGRAGGSVWGEGSLGISAQTAASATHPVPDQADEEDGWMDGSES